MTIVGSRGNTQLLNVGPIVAVDVSPSSPVLLKRRQMGRKNQTVREPALIDTGASGTCIDTSLAKALNLVHRDVITVVTPNGQSQQKLYDVRLTISALASSHLASLDLAVTEANLLKQPYKVLIGRDVLSLGTLIYSGWTNSFELCI